MARKFTPINDRLSIGLLFIMAGVLFLLDTLNIYNSSALFFDWWPLIIVYFGVVHLTRNRVGGWFRIGLGIFLLFLTLDYFEWDTVLRFWPLLLIAGGIAIIYQSRFLSGDFWKTRFEISDNSIRLGAVFGGAEHRVTSPAMSSGDISAIFGGCHVDMRETHFSKDGCIVRVTVLLGGVEISVPEHADIQVRGLPFLGGIENKAKSSEGATPVVLDCSVTFGGIEIHN